MVSIKINLSVECRSRSPTLWTIAGMASSGNPSGASGIMCKASMQLSGTCNAWAIALVGCANWALTNWRTTSCPSSWNTCNGVMNLCAGLASFGCSWIWGRPASGRAAREVELSAEDPACELEDDINLAGWWRTTSWKPSPWAMTWWGRSVYGMSCHPNVTVHSWYRHMSAASAACAMSNPLTWGSKDAATENSSKASCMVGKTVINPGNLSNWSDCVTTKSMMRKLFLGVLGGSG